MTQKTEFYRHPTIFRSVICTAVIALFACAADAAVVSRGAATSARPSVTTRGNATTGRMPTTTVSTTTDTNTTTTTNNQSETTTTSDATDTSDDSDEMVIENRSSYFDEILSESSTSNTDTSAATLAELVAAQRAELDAQDAITTANTVLSGNQNACDVGLRACMREKCGNDFTGCSGDTDTMWGNKMDSCRNDIDATCTGEEYRLFAAEIKSDRDINARLASYNAILDCGNRYNDCIMTECGVTFSKCLGKSAGDAAIAKCETIANNCIEQDSGLASRAMQVFANLRVDAEEQVMRDEERLYELRDQMANQCQTLGAMFDERTFSCVYTVNFYAGDDSTLYASKKAYAGDVFDCTPNWFGIDITTFMENAYRLTREQTSASSALLGSGLGVAAGAITSGAIDRAIDRHKAEKALKDAQDEYDENYGSDDSDTDGDKKASTKDKKSDDKKSDDKDNKQSDDDTNDKKSGLLSTSRPSQQELQDACAAVNGTWKNGFCSDPQCGENEIYDDFNGKCKERDPETTPLTISDQEQRCNIVGTWFNGKCICDNGGTFNTVTGMCECGANQKYNSETKKCEMDLQIGLTPGLSGNNTGGGLLGGTNSGLGGGLLNTNSTGKTLGTRTTRGVSSR